MTTLSKSSISEQSRSWGRWTLDHLRPFDQVQQLHSSRAVATIRRRRFGCIEVTGGQLQRILLRPVARRPSVLGIWWQGRQVAGRASGDRCWLYYHQPWTMPAFLALTYLVSTRDATFGTVCRALEVLDRVAEIKDTYAIVCQVSNQRISDRMLQRMQWQRHVLQSRRRHYIKRLK